MAAELPHLRPGHRLLACSLPVQDELPVPALLDLAIQAEDLGYDWLFLGEIAGPEAFSLLGAIAASTDSIGLATSIVSIYGRSPALLAMGYATLDALAPGRILAGVGAGSRLIAEDWHDRPFEQPAKRMAEVVTSIRTLLTGQRVREIGELAPVSRFRLMPATSHEVPILVAAIQPRMLKVAGAVADFVYLAFCPEDEIGERISLVRQGAEEAGRDPKEVTIGLTLNVYAGDELEAAERRMRKFVLHYASLPTHQEGFAAHRAQLTKALALLEDGDRDGAAAALPWEVVDRVAAIGTPAEVASRVSRYWDAGIDVMALHVLGAGDGDVSGPRQTAEAVIRELRPDSESRDAR
ncbi:MAG: LLM class flavin-dependent oxidoreductase [Microthrixaceae bacterium]